MNVQLKDITVTARDGRGQPSRAGLYPWQPRALLYRARYVEVTLLLSIYIDFECIITNRSHR